MATWIPIQSLPGYSVTLADGIVDTGTAFTGSADLTTAPDFGGCYLVEARFPVTTETVLRHTFRQWVEGGEQVGAMSAGSYTITDLDTLTGIAIVSDAGPMASEFSPGQIERASFFNGNCESLVLATSSSVPEPNSIQLDMSIEVMIGQPEPAGGYNCACDDGEPTVTLQEMRNRLARRLGFSVQVSMGALPPGMPELLDDFIRSTHELMYQRYSVMRMRRMFTWDMQQGVRFYDLDGNSDECTRVLNPDKLEWVGISQGDSSWRPLICGISPVLYGSGGFGIPSNYEIRQCIEVWPPPSDDTWQLRIKGDFGPSPLEADTDVLTVDPEAVFLQALANAKAHYGQADAANYASQATAYVRSRVAGSHQTRRYIPGSCVQPPMVRPVLKED